MFQVVRTPESLYTIHFGNNLLFYYFISISTLIMPGAFCNKFSFSNFPNLFRPFSNSTFCRLSLSFYMKCKIPLFPCVGRIQKKEKIFVKTKAELFQTSERNARCKNRIPVKTKKNLCNAREKKYIRNAILNRSLLFTAKCPDRHRRPKCNNLVFFEALHNETNFPFLNKLIIQRRYISVVVYNYFFNST
jgi:hypothetical protein